MVSKIIKVDEKILQLKKELDKVSNQQDKLQVLLKLATTLCSIKGEECLTYANEALKLGRDLQARKEVCVAQRIIAHAYTTLNEYDQALLYNNTAYKAFTEEFDDKFELFHTLYNYSKIYHFSGDIPNGRKYSKMMMDLSEKIEDVSFLLRACATVALHAFRQGNYPEAKLSIIKGLARDDESGTNSHAILYNAVGIVYSSQDIYETSITYYNKAIEVWKNLGLIEYYGGYVYNNIGNIHNKTGYLEEAYASFNLALSYFEKNDDKRNIALVNSNLGKNQLEDKNPEASLPFFNKSLSIAESLSDKYQISITCLHIASALYEMKEPHKKIKEYLDRALLLSNEVKNKEVSKEAFDLYTQLHLEEEDLPKAMAYQKQFIDVKEQMLSKDVKDIQQNHDALIQQIDDLFNENKELKIRLKNIEQKLEKFFPE